MHSEFQPEDRDMPTPIAENDSKKVKNEEPTELENGTSKIKAELAEYEDFLEEIAARKEALLREDEEQIIQEEENERNEVRKRDFNETGASKTGNEENI